jgi:hypothetical protein
MHSGSTAISKCFAQQGIKISIRKGRKTRPVADRTSPDNHPALEDSDTEKEDPTTSTTANEQSLSSASATTTTTTKPSYRRIHISTFLSSP